MKIPILVFLSYICTSALGQNPTKGNFQNPVEMVAEGYIKEVDENGDSILEFDFGQNNLAPYESAKVVKKYKGNPYYGNQWYWGTVTLKGSEPSPGYIGFNVVNEVIYFSTDKDTRAIELTPPKFELDGLVFLRLDDRIEGAKNHYYNILVEGEPMLLKQHTGSFSSTKDRVSFLYGITAKSEYEGKFKKSEDYCFVVGQKIVPVKPKKFDLKSLGPFATKAKTLITQYELDLKNNKDIVRLAELLNQ